MSIVSGCVTNVQMSKKGRVVFDFSQVSNLRIYE
jgi:hypothetical protein